MGGKIWIYVSSVYLGFIDTKEIQDIWETHEDQIDTCIFLEIFMYFLPMVNLEDT